MMKELSSAHADLTDCDVYACVVSPELRREERRAYRNAVSSMVDSPELGRVRKIRVPKTVVTK